MSGEIALWPWCAECSNAQGGLKVPPEGYDVERELAKSPLCSFDVVVRAWCSHGSGTRKYAHARFEVPFFWNADGIGDHHVLAAIANLKFFTPGERSPDHGLVTRIN